MQVWRCLPLMAANTSTFLTAAMPSCSISLIVSWQRSGYFWRRMCKPHMGMHICRLESWLGLTNKASLGYPNKLTCRGDPVGRPTKLHRRFEMGYAHRATHRVAQQNCIDDLKW